jgi:hypothetical protein
VEGSHVSSGSIKIRHIYHISILTSPLRFVNASRSNASDVGRDMGDAMRTDHARSNATKEKAREGESQSGRPV